MIIRDLSDHIISAEHWEETLNNSRWRGTMNKDPYKGRSQTQLLAASRISNPFLAIFRGPGPGWGWDVDLLINNSVECVTQHNPYNFKSQDGVVGLCWGGPGPRASLHWLRFRWETRYDLGAGCTIDSCTWTFLSVTDLHRNIWSRIQVRSVCYQSTNSNLEVGTYTFCGVRSDKTKAVRRKFAATCGISLLI